MLLRIPALLAIMLVEVIYRRGIGRLLPKVCRFEPSCSTYMIEALRVHGLIKGLMLGSWRLLRCNPLCRGGYDPVPERGVRFINIFLRANKDNPKEETDN